MQQHEQQTLQQQTPFEADLQESVNALMEEEEQPVAPLSPLSEAEEEQGMGRITNPRIVDVLQSSSKLQTLYKKVLARKKIGHKMSSNEVRLLCDGVINMYRKEELELSFSQCKELGRQLLELCPTRGTFGARRIPRRSEASVRKQNVPLPHLPRPATGILGHCRTRHYRNLPR
ncbi:GL23387 [Drosophila persimilis]|uniref:GL23387 n=1 Tax=Drosophila persimilis TaxID=7234 RepID=B4G446_DROPE|nr:GL23387 [Drosophila persimilis]